MPFRFHAPLSVRLQTVFRSFKRTRPKSGFYSTKMGKILVLGGVFWGLSRFFDGLWDGETREVPLKRGFFANCGTYHNCNWVLWLQ